MTELTPEEQLRREQEFAWDKGYVAALDWMSSRLRNDTTPSPTNPYRKEKTE